MNTQTYIPRVKSRFVVALHWTIVRILASLVGILAGHLWSLPIVMVIGVLFAAAESTRLTAYVTEPTGAELCIDSIWISFSLVWISLLCQYFGWTWTAVAFAAIAAGVLAGVFTTAVTRKDDKFVVVDRVML